MPRRSSGRNGNDTLDVLKSTPSVSMRGANGCSPPSPSSTSHPANTHFDLGFATSLTVSPAEYTPAPDTVPSDSSSDMTSR